jgi:hypothetical protein
MLGSGLDCEGASNLQYDCRVLFEMINRETEELVWDMRILKEERRQFSGLYPHEGMSARITNIPC